MDARINIETRLASRHATAAVASVGSVHAALHLQAIAARGIKFDSFDVAEIFKKTPDAADSKPGSRHVAKDMFEVAGRRFSGTARGLCVGAAAGASNVKLTGAKPAEHETKRKARKTNHRSGAPWKFAQDIGPAVDGAVPHPGEAHEKQCYADI